MSDEPPLSADEERPILLELADGVGRIVLNRKRKLNSLNAELESQVLLSYLEGKSYQEMARDLNRHVKSIDNALQRVKRKIEKNLAEIELP